MSALTFNDQLIKLSDVLKYFALSLTRDREQAEDLLQDTMMKALTYKDKFSENTNLKAWLYTIMKNTFINNYRKAQRSRTVITTRGDVEVLDFVAGQRQDTPDSRLSLKELTKLVDLLEPQYRVPFTLHNKGFKYKEIAEELNIPIGTVKSRIHLAKQRLQSQLRHYRS
ncbi:MAG: RNA polymerase sigma-70 factor (ECF subfamily) [Granulosicoccus sp.]|jgi:RNA polymerase sigma-70 factor (ECF subfamily)